jgi:two-component sensor histidine kinase
MQVVSSLLSLQASGLPEHLVAPLRDARDRVHAMALVHENLYQSTDLAHVDAAEYLRSLIQPLRHAHGAVALRVAVTVDVGAVTLPMDAAVPCGLIVNELVTNAFKHAFPDGEARGEIGVQLRADPDGRCHLSVRDTGIGLPPGLPHGPSGGPLGLRLVTMLVQQLHGQLEIDRESGTRFDVVFGGPPEAAPTLAAAGAPDVARSA